MTKHEIKLCIEALWDARLWQLSIADAHTLTPWNQTKELTAVKNRALRLANRYTTLHDALRKKELMEQ